MPKVFTVGMEKSIFDVEDQGRVDKKAIVSLPTNQIISNDSQPRYLFQDETLNELAVSIKEQGIIQPILVQPTDGKDYKIIAGERRWRAAQIAGLSEIPVVIKQDVSKENILFLALIENLQREDLNAIEESRAYKKLTDSFQLTHEEISKKVGKSRSEITNKLRLLNLNTDVQKMLENKALSYGHVKILLTLDNDLQLQVAKEIFTNKLNVRDAEKLVQYYLAAEKSEGQSNIQPPNIYKEQANLLGERIANKLATKVKLLPNSKGEGRAVIYFSSLDEIEWLANKLEE
jgi:ParB family transcriptional regulator, chromosome partitioning protein